MNKTKMNFISLLSRVGLEKKATDSLVVEMRKQLPTLDEMQDNTARLKEVIGQYDVLSNQMTTEKQELESEIAELRMEINKLDIESTIVDTVMEINDHIDAKQARIKALESAQIALGQKNKLEQKDILADCFKNHRKALGESNQLVQTSKPMINDMNRESIKKALLVLDREVEEHAKVYTSTAQSIGAEKSKYEGIDLYCANNSAYMPHRI